MHRICVALCSRSTVRQVCGSGGGGEACAGSALLCSRSTVRQVGGSGGGGEACAESELLCPRTVYPVQGTGNGPSHKEDFMKVIRDAVQRDILVVAVTQAVPSPYVCSHALCAHRAMLGSCSAHVVALAQARE
eukprot:4251968-Prymnesium_polylepis.1